MAQPQEGSKLVACATTRYELELFSGTVVGEPESEALNAGQGSVLQRLFRQREVAQANHSLVVRSPAGESRTFRVATTSAAVPARVRPCSG